MYISSLKDGTYIFQRPFMAESGKKFSAKSFFNLKRTIFQSQKNETQICAKRKAAFSPTYD